MTEMDDVCMIKTGCILNCKYIMGVLRLGIMTLWLFNWKDIAQSYKTEWWLRDNTRGVKGVNGSYHA